MPERALLSSPLGSRTAVHSPRGLLGKTRPAVRYCSLQCRLERRRSVGLMPDRREAVALFRLTAVVYDWLALCREPCANSVVFLARRSILLPAPGTSHTGQLVRKYPLPSVKIRTTAPTNKRCLQNSKPGFVAGTVSLAYQAAPHSKSLKTSQTSHRLPLKEPIASLYHFSEEYQQDKKDDSVKDEAVQHIKCAAHSGDPVAGIFHIAHPLDC